jgi:hypothetical protein
MAVELRVRGSSVGTVSFTYAPVDADHVVRVSADTRREITLPDGSRGRLRSTVTLRNLTADAGDL